MGVGFFSLHWEVGFAYRIGRHVRMDIQNVCSYHLKYMLHPLCMIIVKDGCKVIEYKILDFDRIRAYIATRSSL